MYKLLIVDDEKLIREGLIDYIDWEHHGIQVAGTASDGETALRLAHDLRPHIIITDIKMASMDGIQLLKTLRAEGIESELIFISAYSRFEYAQEALRHGAFDYILKPIEEAKLVDVVRRCVTKLQSTAVAPDSADLAPPPHHEEGSRVVLCFRASEPTGQESEERESGIAAASCERFTNMVARNSKLVIAESWSEGATSTLCVVSCASRTGDSLREDVQRALEELVGRPHPHDDSAAQAAAGPSCHVGVSRVCDDGGCDRSRLVVQAKAALLFPEVTGPAAICLFEAIADGVRLPDDTYDEVGVIAAGLVEGCAASIREGVQVAWRRMIAQELIYDIEAVRTRTRELISETCHRLAGSNQCFRDAPICEPGRLRTAIEAASDVHAIADLTMSTLTALADYLERQPGGRAGKLVTTAMAYIETHISQSLSLREVADVLLITPGYLSRLFREEAGQTFSHYVTHCRIEAAKEQLADPRTRIQDIARSIGYSDLAHFSKVFKAATGVTPSQHRKVSKLSRTLMPPSEARGHSRA